MPQDDLRIEDATAPSVRRQLNEAIDALALGEGGDFDADYLPQYDDDRSVCHLKLRYPLGDAETGDLVGSVRLRRMTRRDVITALGVSTWSEPTSQKAAQLMAKASGLPHEQIVMLDFGDWLNLQAALKGFTEPHTPSPSSEPTTPDASATPEPASSPDATS